MSVDVADDLNRVDALIDVNRPDEALALVTSVLAAAPDSARAYCLLARCHSMKGDHAAMYRAATDAIRCAPESEWGHRLRSMALRNLGRVEEAVTAAETAVRLAPLVWQPHVNLVEALIKFPEPELRRRAYEAATTAVEIAPMVSSTHVTLGRVYMSIGEWDDASACFGRALALHPEDASAQTNNAILDLHRGRIAAAGRTLRAVAGAHPGVPTHLHNVTVVARHWWARLRDVGALICLVQLVLDVCTRTGDGPLIGLGLTVAYLVTVPILVARQPKAMRPLVRAQMRLHDPVNLLLGIAFVMVTWMTVATLGTDLSGGSGFTGGPVSVVLLTVIIVIWIWERLPTRLEPYRLRRRYRATVLGGTVSRIPRQRPAPR